MTCPDIEELLRRGPAALRHAEICQQCAARLELVTQIREALDPDIELPEHHVQAILEGLSAERTRRGIWEIIATSTLAAATVSPIVLAGYGQRGKATPEPFTLILLVLVAILIITVLEPKVMKQV